MKKRERNQEAVKGDDENKKENCDVLLGRVRGLVLMGPVTKLL